MLVIWGQIHRFGCGSLGHDGHELLTHPASSAFEPDVIEFNRGSAADTQFAPVRPMVPSNSAVGAFLRSWLISNLTRPSTTDGSHSPWPFFLLIHHERTRGMLIPHAGLGQVTVRVQIQAITVAAEPSGRVALG